MKRMVLSVFAFLALSGCEYAYLRDREGLMAYYGPAGILETVEARRVLHLSNEQIEAVRALRLESPDGRSREEAMSDAKFIQSLIFPFQAGLAPGRIENHIRGGVHVKIYEMGERGEKGKFVRELYLPPNSSTQVTLKNGTRYIFSYLERKSFLKQEWRFSEPAEPGWVCQYIPV